MLLWWLNWKQMRVNSALINTVDGRSWVWSSSVLLRLMSLPYATPILQCILHSWVCGRINGSCEAYLLSINSCRTWLRLNSWVENFFVTQRHVGFPAVWSRPYLSPVVKNLCFCPICFSAPVLNSIPTVSSSVCLSQTLSRLDFAIMLGEFQVDKKFVYSERLCPDNDWIPLSNLGAAAAGVV